MVKILEKLKDDEQIIVRLYVDNTIRKYFERKPLRVQTYLEDII